MAAKTQLGTGSPAIMGRRYGSFAGRTSAANPVFPDQATLSLSGAASAPLSRTGVAEASLSRTGASQATLSPRTS